jgi:cytochrome c-type biogenesis protein CcmE
MKNYVKYIIAFGVVAVTLGYFFISSMTAGRVYYSEVSELIGNAEMAMKRNLRVSGIVTDDNFSVNKFEKTAKFEVTDDLGGIMNVVYSGNIPDAFETGASVIITGTYDVEKNIFTARQLMAKCPSKYEAAEPENPQKKEEEQKHPDDVKKS